MGIIPCLLALSDCPSLWIGQWLRILMVIHAMQSMETLAYIGWVHVFFLFFFFVAAQNINQHIFWLWTCLEKLTWSYCRIYSLDKLWAHRRLKGNHQAVDFSHFCTNICHLILWNSSNPSPTFSGSDAFPFKLDPFFLRCAQTSSDERLTFPLKIIMHNLYQYNCYRLW